MDRTMSVAMAVICGIFAGTVASAGEVSTRFEDYPVQGTYKGAPAPIALQTKGDRMYRTVLREAAAKGPDFASHYKIATWGCGSGCITYAIIDSNTGKILPKSGGIVSRSCKQSDDEAVLNYQRDSRLLIVSGTLNDEDLGMYYYELKDNKLNMLKELPHPRKDASCY